MPVWSQAPGHRCRNSPSSIQAPDLMDQVDTIPCGGKNSKTRPRTLVVKKKNKCREDSGCCVHFDSCVLPRLINI